MAKFREDRFYVLTPNKGKFWNGLRYDNMKIDMMRNTYGKENIIIVYDSNNRIAKSRNISHYPYIPKLLKV